MLETGGSLTSLDPYDPVLDRHPAGNKTGIIEPTSCFPFPPLFLTLRCLSVAIELFVTLLFYIHWLLLLFRLSPTTE